MKESKNKKPPADSIEFAAIPLDREFHCKGQFKGMNKGRPNEDDLKAAAEFAGKIIG